MKPETHRPTTKAIEEELPRTKQISQTQKDREQHYDIDGTSMDEQGVRIGSKEEPARRDRSNRH